MMGRVWVERENGWEKGNGLAGVKREIEKEVGPNLFFKELGGNGLNVKRKMGWKLKTKWAGRRKRKMGLEMRIGRLEIE